MLLQLLIAVLSCFLAFYLYRRFYAIRIFAKQGLPGPEPHWLLGNLPAFADETKRHRVIPEWTKKYGKMYAFYEGSAATLVIADVDMVTKVFVKQANVFNARKIQPLQADSDDVNDGLSHIIYNTGERWKRVRSVVNPAFTTTKLRNLSPLMAKCQTDFMDTINEAVQTNGDNTFDIFDVYQRLVLDAICEASLGVEVNSLRSKDSTSSHPILETLREYWRVLYEAPLIVAVAMIFPDINWLLEKFERFRGDYFNSGFDLPKIQLERMMTQIIKERKANPSSNRQDLLQMMLAMEVPAERISEQKGLTPKEVVAQALVFVAAAYETTSNTLAFITFQLAVNSDVQDKLIKEIDQRFSKDPGLKVDIDSVSELNYLDCVINETLRFYDVGAASTSRRALEDTEIDGVRIPKGVAVLADAWTIHRDKDEWGPVDPEKFYPERFLDDYPSTSTRSAASFIPFGFGPRICIGMRFAMIEMKMTLVNLLRKYRIEKSPQTGDILGLKTSFATSPAGPVLIKLRERTKF